MNTDIAIVCAIAKNNAIGRNGGMPWQLVGEQALFKRITTGHAVVMGRKTYDSVPKRPLPERLNIVISRTVTALEGAHVVPSFAEAISFARQHPVYGQSPTMVIGGAEIYRLALPYAKFYYRTLVDATPEADVFFHDFDPSAWTKSKTIAVQEPSSNAAGYCTELWVRHKNLEKL